MQNHLWLELFLITLYVVNGAAVRKPLLIGHQWLILIW